MLGVPTSGEGLDDSFPLAVITEVGYSGRTITDGLDMKSNPREVAVVAIISFGFYM